MCGWCSGSSAAACSPSCVAVWIALGDEIRGQFTPLQRATLVLIGLLLFVAVLRAERCKVVATDAGLTVVNGYRNAPLRVAAAASGSRCRRGAPWATLDLSDGTTFSVMGIQGSDGARARRAVRRDPCIAANTPMNDSP